MGTMRISKLMRWGSVAILIRFLSAALGFGLIFVMSKWMTTTQFGHFGFAFSVATTVSLVTDLGQQRLILRSLAAYRERDRPDLMRAVLRYSMAKTAMGALLAVLIIFAFNAVSDMNASATAVALLSIGMLAADFQAHILRGLGSLVGSLVPREIAWRPIALGILALIGGGISILVDANAAIWVLALSLAFLTFIQFLFLTRPRWRAELTNFAKFEEPASGDEETISQSKAGWRASSMRLWAVSAMNSGILPFSVVVVGLFVSPAETGAFFAVVRIAAVIAFPLQGLNLLTSPLLARAYAANDRDRLQSVASFTALWSTAAALAGIAVLAFFGELLLGLLNQEFASSATTQLVVMCGFLIAAMCGSSGQLMNMTGHDREFLRILLIANPIGFASLILLSYLYGGLGAAFGLLILKASWNIWVVFWARRNLGIDPSVAAYLLPLKERAL